MASHFDRAASVAVILAAASIAYAALSNGQSAGDAQTPRAASAPVYVPEWKHFESVGHRIGSDSADVTFVEFADFECPYCREFNSAFREFSQKVDGDVALVFVHYPLPQHKFSRQAATASECAANQGQFGNFVELAFSKQDSIGLKSWESFATEAGVGNITQFRECLTAPEIQRRIDSAVQAADKIGIAGTPTIILNGWRVDRIRYRELERLVADIKSRSEGR